MAQGTTKDFRNTELGMCVAIDARRKREAAKAQRPQPVVEEPTRHEPYRSLRAQAALGIR